MDCRGQSLESDIISRAGPGERWWDGHVRARNPEGYMMWEVRGPIYSTLYIIAKES